MSKQFIVSIILLNVAVAATVVMLVVITAHVVIIVAIKHALSCESRVNHNFYKKLVTNHAVQCTISFLHEKLIFGLNK